jgi:hypothetical protein
VKILRELATHIVLTCSGSLLSPLPSKSNDLQLAHRVNLHPPVLGVQDVNPVTNARAPFFGRVTLQRKVIAGLARVLTPKLPRRLCTYE